MEHGYLMHYGVKGMKWHHHKYKTIKPDGSYEKGTLKTGKGFLEDEHHKDGSYTNGPITRYASDKKVSINPNAKHFGVSIKKDKAKVTDILETQRWRKNSTGGYTGNLKEHKKYSNVTTKNDPYLQINYNKKKLDKTVSSIKSTASNAKKKVSNLLNKFGSHKISFKR